MALVFRDKLGRFVKSSSRSRSISVFSDGRKIAGAGTPKAATLQAKRRRVRRPAPRRKPKVSPPRKFGPDVPRSFRSAFSKRVKNLKSFSGNKRVIVYAISEVELRGEDAASIQVGLDFVTVTWSIRLKRTTAAKARKITEAEALRLARAQGLSGQVVRVIAVVGGDPKNLSFGKPRSGKRQGRPPGKRITVQGKR